ncbi:hypothetical protein DM02DRAFT_660894 [Periconia macrospinosa]|uniref:Uncharacterized protein n=1 Tax=Periconia macrospinosa TaxID=97972 RepID=A0A2V1D975_9PLEO|nr:hypothetical protein DM02DRAFT_660894 [Periconia macrospinosa]
MEYNIPSVIPYSPPPLTGYFDSFVQHPYTMQDASAWIPTLNKLRGQRVYLEDLLAKTATKLNALRDKQTRNERTLNANPEYSRSKKKKIAQNKWRTNKTIQTCENEERAILECLRVCKSNIDMLESVLHPAGSPSAVPDYNSLHSYTESDLGGVQWNTGWTDDGDPASPFETCRGGPVTCQEIAPEDAFGPSPVLVGDAALAGFPYLVPLPPHVQGYSTSAPSAVPQLSAEAAVFKPTTTKRQNEVGDLSVQIDKLSISGLLSSKYVKQQLARRSFPNRVTNRSTVQPARGPNADEHSDPSNHSDPSSAREEQHKEEAELPVTTKRMNSV